MDAPPWTRDELCRFVRAGGAVDYLFFWGHAAHPSGRVAASCLSQWWPSPFEVGARRFATAEHYMMAEKARLFGDAEAERAILAAASPAAAKKLGRQVRRFDEAVWAAQRFDIVVAGTLAKFGQDDALGRFLLATGTRVLVEASPFDRIWGIGVREAHPLALDPLRWPGLNLLGFALMAARHTLARAALA